MNEKQILEIWEGWSNWIFQESLSDDQRTVAAKRLEACKNCQYKEKTKLRRIYDAITGDKKPRETGFKCGICHCPIKKKVLCFSCSCPLPEHEGKSYPHKNRWSTVTFDKNDNLIGSDNVQVTSPSENPESFLPQ